MNTLIFFGFLLEPDSGEHDDNVVFNLIDDCNDEAGMMVERVMPQNVLIISSLAVQKLWASIKSHPKIGNQQEIPVKTAFSIKLILFNL